MSTKPVLRPLDFQPVYYQGQSMWLLRDPLRLSSRQLIVPQALAPLFLFMDGNRDIDEIYTAFCKQVGEQVDYELVTDALAQVDEACLLDNERSRQAQQRLLAEYRAQPHRPPALAGLGYPDSPQELVKLFQQYGQSDPLPEEQSWHGRAVISPHIDYQRGGPVYARVWQQAQQAVAEADLVLILGTDHNGGYGSLTLTRQSYATPFGVLPSDPALVDSLAEAIGPDEAFALELNHREEHSVELSAVWLHYICQQKRQAPPPMVPVLCGSFHHFVSNGHQPADDERLGRFIDTLYEATRGRRVLVVASVDLAHVGPQFGDSFPMTSARQAQLRHTDMELIEAISEGDYGRFYDKIASVRDRNRICGFSAIYLMLRYLEKQGAVQGQHIAYEHCLADEAGDSFVSICGILLK